MMHFDIATCKVAVVIVKIELADSTRSSVYRYRRGTVGPAPFVSVGQYGILLALRIKRKINAAHFCCARLIEIQRQEADYEAEECFRNH